MLLIGFLAAFMVFLPFLPDHAYGEVIYEDQTWVVDYSPRIPGCRLRRQDGPTFLRLVYPGRSGRDELFLALRDESYEHFYQHLSESGPLHALFYFAEDISVPVVAGAAERNKTIAIRFDREHPSYGVALKSVIDAMSEVNAVRIVTGDRLFGHDGSLKQESITVNLEGAREALYRFFECNEEHRP